MSVAVRAMLSHSGRRAGEFSVALSRADAARARIAARDWPNSSCNSRARWRRSSSCRAIRRRVNSARSTFGELVEHVADGRKLGKIEWRQAGGEIVGGDAFETLTDQVRWTKRARQCRIDERAQERQRQRERGHQTASLVPGLGGEHGRIGPGDRFAKSGAVNLDGADGLATWIEEVLVERREDLRRMAATGFCATAKLLNDVSAVAPIGNA